jgi:hypothetical protein
LQKLLERCKKDMLNIGVYGSFTMHKDTVLGDRSNLPLRPRLQRPLPDWVRNPSDLEGIVGYRKKKTVGENGPTLWNKFKNIIRGQ